MELSAEEREALEKLRPTGRSGATAFALACAERLRPLLRHVPSGAPPLVAGGALTQLWRVIEGAERADPRALKRSSEACWTLVDIEDTPEVPAALLELLVAAAHHALETYLSGNPEQAMVAAQKLRAATGAKKTLLAAEAARQSRDLAELTRGVSPAVATRLRERSEREGAQLVAALLEKP